MKLRSYEIAIYNKKSERFLRVRTKNYSRDNIDYESVTSYDDDDDDDYDDDDDDDDDYEDDDDNDNDDDVKMTMHWINSLCSVSLCVIRMMWLNHAHVTLDTWQRSRYTV